ncbi:Sarcosine oxidase gamma subunit [Methylocella silvestris BL2]|uniref:Sarcosine oxidase gamma subunit n=1 Tax=Methylocella silvestris (strain DSM 15510 / CIP 108128 / LMG 27833 / NCIMB 13906 / BL2) TaxID=395965 RepID=B8EQ72_METSB|nr:sarcosine oxidase subunit gamma family protein [Methylocella silvestris]ACK51562.1 Sarcosine oxidase gamma subunit [Methylocella silvestris BL2]
MSDSLTLPGLALDLAPHYLHPGRSGPPGDPGVILELIGEEDRFIIEARRGRVAELLASLAKSFGAAPVDAPRTIAAGGFDFVGVGPSRWHAISRGDGRAQRRAALAAAALESATVFDVSHGFVTFQLSGRSVVETLAKLAPIDLGEQGFAPGACAMTQIHGMSVQLRRTLDGGFYECAVPRSFAGSLYHALTDAALRFGLTVAPPQAAI